MFSNKSMFWMSLISAVLIAIITFTAQGQNITGSIIGRVTDSSGAAIAGATVTATSKSTAAVRSIQTSDTGDFRFLSLPTGTYKVDIEDAGFKHYSRDPIEVVVDQAARVDTSLEIGDVSQQVVVTSEAPIIQAENASLGQIVSGKTVTDIPLNGRNVLALVSLVPGVVPQGGSSTSLTGQNVFAAGNYQIGGGTANQSSVLVDGGPVNISYGNPVVLVPDQDVVQEFRVQTNNNTAEYGMYVGGVINIATKQGTNAFHGTAYEYVRNTVLDANDFFSNRSGAGRQAFHQNQFGGNIGGPIWKDKVFFFGDYQGYRQSFGMAFLMNVPTPAMLKGDFSALSTPIYDPLTTCGYNGNPACVPGQPTRKQFSYMGRANVIDPSRFSTVAKSLIGYPYFANPTSAGDPGTAFNNFSKHASAGGTNDQYNIRSDQQISSKQRLFERYTLWKSEGLSPDPYGNKLLNGTYPPEDFTTNQIVVGDTYVFSPTTIADLRISYLRWNYIRTPGSLGYDEASLGFPPYMSQIPALNGFSPSNTIPYLSFASPTYNSASIPGLIFAINNNYAIAPTFTKILGKHTLKFGADLRRLEWDFFQNNSPGGSFKFDNVFTSANAASPGNTGNPVASFLLGYAASGIVQIAPPTFSTMYYQGYYVMDTWQASEKLTLTLGLRYEIPGTYVERHGRYDTFNPTEMNPIVGIPGAFDLVSTPQHPAKGLRNEHYDNFSPRIGLAYRLSSNTVIRAGWGKFVIPADLQFTEAPGQAGVAYLNNNQVASNNGNQTPLNTLDNPFPNGLVGAPGRNSDYQQQLLGGSASATLQDEPNGFTYQWNLAVQHQLPYGVALEAAYAGLHGAHLPITVAVNQLPDRYLTQAAQDPNCVGPTANLATACFLTKQVANPFYGKISQGTLQNPTIQQNQLLLPFPQYGNIPNPGSYQGVNNYNALQIKLEKRLPNGGTLLGSYTFSKVLANAETLTSWLEPGAGGLSFQDNNNIPKEYSLSSFDSRHRLVISYVYQLPIGKGQLFFHGVSGVGDKLISGWGVNGVSTFQDGYPLGLTATPNNTLTYALAGNLRPNVVSGCQKHVGGSAYNRLGGVGSSSNWFNTSCFTIPSVFTYGNESRTDGAIRSSGIANYDLAAFKDTHISERITLQLRIESFNLFNRVQFGPPNQVIGNSQFGQVTTQQNLPRLLQLAGRISF